MPASSCRIANPGSARVGPSLSIGVSRARISDRGRHEDRRDGRRITQISSRLKSVPTVCPLLCAHLPQSAILPRRAENCTSAGKGLIAGSPRRSCGPPVLDGPGPAHTSAEHMRSLVTRCTTPNAPPDLSGTRGRIAGPNEPRLLSSSSRAHRKNGSPTQRSPGRRPRAIGMPRTELSCRGRTDGCIAGMMHKPNGARLSSDAALLLL